MSLTLARVVCSGALEEHRRAMTGSLSIFLLVLMLHPSSINGLPMAPSTRGGHISQLATSTPNITASKAFYEAVGFPYGGAVPDYVRPLVLKTGMIQSIMGLPDLKDLAWEWQAAPKAPEGQSFFQFELLEFKDPPGRSLGRKASDIGISRCGIYVADFEGALQRLSNLGYEPITPVRNFTGHGLRVAVLDPAGAVVELMDTDLAIFDRADVAVRTITMTVPNLSRSTAYLSSIFGLEETDFEAHNEAMEALWGLDGAVRDLVTMGDNSSTLLIELAAYTKPASQPRPADYTIADHGFTHIVGHGTNDHSSFESTYSKMMEGGFTCNAKPVTMPGMLSTVYCHDHDNCTFEVEQFPAYMAGAWGYEAHKDGQYMQQSELRSAMHS